MNMDKNVHDEIARVAYGLYEKRGYTPGNDFSDWMEAEKIVKQKYCQRNDQRRKTRQTDSADEGDSFNKIKVARTIE